MARRRHTVSLEGGKVLGRKLKRLGKSGRLELGKALYREGEDIMATSKNAFVPVDKGVLRASGHVALPTPEPLVVLGYGGPAAPYALAQHEKHYSHDVGQRKYLEIPAIAAAVGMGKRVAKRLWRWLEKSGKRGA